MVCQYGLDVFVHYWYMYIHVYIVVNYISLIDNCQILLTPIGDDFYRQQGAFVDDNSHVTYKIKIFQRVGSIGVKKSECCLPVFLLFSDNDLIELSYL